MSTPGQAGLQDRDVARELLQLMVSHDREMGPDTHVYMSYPHELVLLTSGVPDGAKPGHLDDLERRGCIEITDYTSKGAPKWVVLPAGVLEADRAEGRVGPSDWTRHVQVLAAVKAAEQEAPGGRATVADVAAHLDGEDGLHPTTCALLQRLARTEHVTVTSAPHVRVGLSKAGLQAVAGWPGGESEARTAAILAAIEQRMADAQGDEKTRWAKLREAVQQTVAMTGTQTAARVLSGELGGLIT